MTFGFIRTLFGLISLIVGYQIGAAMGAEWGLIGMGIGGAIALLVILVERGLGKLSLRGLSAAVFGLILALIVSRFITNAIDQIPDLNGQVAGAIKLALVLILCYFGVVFSMRGRDEFNLIIPYVKFDRQDQNDAVLLLDTSAIIDGRIVDVCQTKFLEGRFVIPRFVLKELQQVADSSDPLKRARGRRGLDVLNKLKNSPQANVRIHDDDLSDTLQVDDKLIKLAQVLSAKIITTDYNLNKVAEIQGLTILNVNELANALRPVVLPGEMLDVRLAKEGKEATQAVAYLDDGTMVVVDNARKLIGSQVKVSVTSVLQTAAGRMIFARLAESDKK